MNAQSQRKAQIFTVLLVAMMSLASCGDGKDLTQADFPEIKVSEPSAELLAEGAVLSGTARFVGTHRRTEYPMSSDSVCQAMSKGEKIEDIVTKDGNLRDVLVYVTEGLETYTFDWERKEAELDQKACIYVPHVIAVRTRQPIKFINSDATTHNVDSSSGTKQGQGFNKTMNAKGSTFTWHFPKEEIGLRVKCDVHPWMNAVIHVVSHPYFAITNEDGEWTFPRPLPPGQYTLTAIHPILGSYTNTVHIDRGPTLQVEEFSFTR
jgi:plastocyanin